MRCFFLFIFFFFQAEDGIRDRNVTGVQTCALPISEACRGAPEHCALATRHDSEVCERALLGAAPARLGVPVAALRRQTLRRRGEPRSEERRVGKERRARRGDEPEQEGGKMTMEVET